MSTIIGLVVVFAAVLGGFAMAGGPFPVLIQPNELVIIGGAAVGTLVIAAPGSVRTRVQHAVTRGFKVRVPGRADYLQLLTMLYHVLQVVRREGILAMESHASEPEKSPIFKKYPTVTARHHAFAFLTEGLKQLVDGCSVADLAALLEADLDTHHSEEHEPIQLLKTTGDALPGLGIVAAVLGIVVTMGHMDGGPEEIGHHVAAALVGTFLGILLCYGVVAPIATSIEHQSAADARYLACIREGLLAAARGCTPQLAVEFARRALFSDERPTPSELEKAFSQVKLS